MDENLSVEGDRKEPSKFNWVWQAVKAVLLGAFLMLVLVRLAVEGHWIGTMAAALLAPGLAVGVFFFGGIHGGEPFLLSFAVNAFLYAALILLFAWIRHKRRTRGILGPGP